jgi:MFS family permease
MFFIGSIVGYIILGIMADNLGRRLTLLICLFTGIIGYLFILIGPNLFTVEIGLFLTGFGL